MSRQGFVRLALVALVLACAGLATAQIGGFLDGSPEPSSWSRIVPARIQVLADPGQIEKSAGEPWRLFDGDTERGFVWTGEGGVRLRLALGAPRTLGAVGVFGPANGRLTVSAEQDGVPTLLFDLEPRGAGWQRIPVAQPFATRALIVDWQPASPGAALPEMELWSIDRSAGAGEDGPGNGSRIAQGAPAALQVAGGGNGTFRVPLAGDPAVASRAFLSYELTGLSHWSAAVRSINGHAPQGFGATPAAEGALQVEEIDPAWLRPGINEIRFSSAHAAAMPEVGMGERQAAALEKAAETLPYEVRNLRLILEGEAGRTMVPGSWEGASPLSLPLGRPAQPYALEIGIAEGARGVLSVQARLAGGGVMPLLAPVDLGALSVGRHRLPVSEDLPAVAAVELAWRAPKEGRSGKIEGVTLLSSPVGRRQGPSLTLTHPPAGDAAELGTYLRGFVKGPAGVAGPPALLVNGALVPDAVAADGALGAVIPRPAGEEGPWDLSLELAWPDGTRLARLLHLGGGPDDRGDGADRGETGRDAFPDKSMSLSAKGARLEVPPGAVSGKVRITMKPLASGELPALDEGMTNVTPGKGGFRFGPHGQKFKKPIELTLPYDAALIPQGLTSDDVRTYFFDQESGRWVAVERLKASGSVVVSTTNHFTDFINATLTLPDEPASASFNPNSIKDLAKADPGAEIVLLKAPEGGPGGDASLTYPLTLPKGRRGLQPELAVSYSSGAGNGWLGLGWDLKLPSVEISTLFGVPRYDAAFETETYTLQGEQLAPVANPASPAARQAERVFIRRTEGSFERIVRHGSGPAGYWWEVTDKKGVRSIYGRSAQSRLADSGSGNTFRWLLEQEIDLHGNTVDYSYAKDSGSDGEPWVQVYPAAITYTGVNGNGGFYQVLFQTDDGAQRPDRFTSGLSGFKVLTRRRLTQVDVLAGGDLVRRYLFAYREGDFRKSVLESLAVTGEDGVTELARHDFEYQHADAAFGPMQTWSGIGGGRDVTTNLNLGGGVHVYAGLGPPAGAPVAPTCTPLVGIQVGGSVAGTTELGNFLDLNGDGLPDRVDDHGGVDFNRRGTFQSSSASGVSDIGRTLEFTFDVSAGARIPPLNLGVGFVYSHANEDRAFLDLNGDGFPDLVGADGGFHTRLNNGTSFQPASNWGGFGSSGLTLGRPEEENDVLSNLKLSDTLRRLVLPFAGAVKLDGAIQKQQAGGDGVKVQIFHNDTRIWQRTFAASDVTPCVPADGDSCGAGLDLNVQAGDRIYLLTDSIRETSADALLWTPRATYTGQDAEALEPWGSHVYVFDGGDDFRLAGPPGSSWLATGNGTAQIQGALVKQVTSDDVTVQVLKNGDGDNPLYRRTYTADETGSFDEIPSIAVVKGDNLSLQVTSKTPVDPDRVRWTPQVTLSGDQPEQLQQPQKAQVYYAIPKLKPTAQPTVSWIVPAGWDGNLHVDWTAGSGGGSTVLYVQGLHRLYDRRTVSGSTSFDVTVAAAEGDPIFVTALGSGTLAATANGGSVPTNVRTVDEEETVESMSGGWHGWFYGEWNGGKTFHEDGLKLPQSKDDNTPDFMFATPHWEGATGVSQPAWTAGGFDLYMTADGVKPSRQGGNAAGDLDKASGTSGGGGGLDVLRKTTGRTLSADIGIGVGLSLSLGDSMSEVDLIDMNGDRYPDQVSGSGVRFSDGRGGFGGLASFSGLDSAVRRSENGNVSASVGIGTIFTAASGSGKVSKVASTLPTIGATVSMSQTRYDLVDVNGDGLPDRVSMDSGAPFATVRLNLGYRFGAPEAWPLPGWADSGFLSGVGGCVDAVSGIGTTLGQAFVNVASPNAISWTRSSAFTAGAAFGPLGGGGSTTLARTLVQFTDVNGDGLADHVAKEQDEDFFRVKLNRGDYWEPEQRWPVPGWGTSLGTGYVIPGVMRCVDSVSYSGNIAANASLGFAACFTIIPPVPVVGLQFEITGQINGSGGGLQLTFQDLDGDGLPDHVLKKRDDPNVYVKLNQAEKANLLTAVHRPLGGSFSLTYERQGNKVGLSADGQRKVDMPSTQWVLASVTENDGRGNSYTTRYDYFDESYQDRGEREPYGFARVKTTRPDGSTIDRRYKNQDFYQRRLLERETTADASGRLFRVETFEYALRPLGSVAAFPAKVREETQFYEGTGSAQKSTARTYDYDSFGDVTRYTDSGDQGTADDSVATASYHVDPQTYVIQPEHLEVRDGAARLLRERMGTYDALGDLVRLEQVLTGGKAPDTGAPYTGNRNAVWTFTWDGAGNLATVTDATGFTSTFAYDPSARTYPTQVSDSFGYVSRFTWNLKHGKPAETVDKNGQSLRQAYDGFGRLVRVVGPYDTDASPTLAFEYGHTASPAWSVVHHKDAVRSDPIDSSAFIDGLGRTLQTKEDAELDLGTGTSTRTGMRVSGRVEFDAVGRLAAKGQPVFDTSGPTVFVNVPLQNPSSFTYDVLGRVVEARHPQGAVTRMAYGFGTLDGVGYLSHTRTDPNGRATVFYDHVRGQVLGLQQTNTINGTPRTLITRYAYDALTQLLSVTDPEGNVTRVEHDTLGRRVVVDNPDAGRTEMRYTPAGDLGAKITANLAAQGQQIRYLRTFHRLDRIDYPQMPDTLFTYGGPGAPDNRADRIATVTDESGREERSYGRLGETVRSVRTLTALNGFSPKGPYTTTYQYDSFGRLLSMVYPDSETVTWGYDAGGKVKTASGVFQGVRFEYLRHQGYDEFDQRVRTIYGNGVETRWTYEPQSRELAALQSLENGGRKLQELAYRYDLTGTLLGLDNNLPPGRSKEIGGPSSQTFVYDDLYQLVGAQGTYRTAPNLVSSYTLSLAYDEGGDLTAKNQLHTIATGGKPSPQLKTTYNWAYAYGGARPHAPTHIGERTFTYDLDGNQTGWISDVNGNRRVNTWDEENRLKSVADNGQTTRFLYDSEGSRSTKAAQNSETLYVNKWFSVRNGNVISKHVFADDVRLSTKTSTSPNPTAEKVYFFQPDHLGSTHFVTDSLGKAWQHLEYFPSGEVWVDERSATESTPYLFSGKELDEETGLSYFGLRYYDGRQGQWISADPILEHLMSPDRLAEPDLSEKPFRRPGLLYAYVSNSPLNLADALGLEGGDPQSANQQEAAPHAASAGDSAPSARPNAAAASQPLGARAFTGGGDAEASSEQGPAHELAHVVQQKEGGSAGSTTLASAPSAETPAQQTLSLPTQDPAVAKEVQGVIGNIEKGGPFPFKQDNTVFKNREGALPSQPEGFYREFTVRTPGAKNRGAQRLVVGNDGTVYYTGDHYKSFTDTGYRIKP